VAQPNEVAIRDLLRPLLGDAPNVFVGEADENGFPVTITLDSAAARRVNDVQNLQNLVKDPNFATDLSDKLKLGKLISIGSFRTSDEAVGAPTPPPPALPSSSLGQPIIAILSGGVVVTTVLLVCLLHQLYKCRSGSGSA